MDSPELVGVVAKLDHVTTVTSRLIDFAETMLKRPIGIFPDLEVDRIYHDVEQASELMIDGGNPLGPEGMMLISVLSYRARAMDRVKSAKWDIVASVLLLLVRDALAAAMNKKRG